MTVQSVISKWETTATLMRQTATKDTSGGFTQTFAAVAGKTAMPCSNQPTTSSIEFRYAQRETVVDAMIFFEFDIGYENGDMLKIGDEWYKIHGYMDATAGLGKAFRADCEKHVDPN